MKIDGEKIDEPCVKLINTLNKLQGIHTVESCCGHGERPYHIWFKTKSLNNLPQLLYWFDFCHCGSAKWNVIATTDCAYSPVTFMIEGPTGEVAYKEADKIAELIKMYELNKPNL